MPNDTESFEPSPPPPSTPKERAPVPAPQPDHGPPSRGLATMVGLNTVMLLASLGLLGYGVYQQARRPPAPPPPSAAADEIKPEVDRLKVETKDLAKKLEERPAIPDPTPQVMSLDEKVADLAKSVGEIPAKLDAMVGPKLEAAGKDQAARVDAIEKKVADLGQSIDALKADLGTRAAASPAVTLAPVAAEARAMDPAVDLFRKGRYAEAKDAFARLQATHPEDARVWYFSALANGLATRDWKGESERLVTAGMAREKAGSPDKSTIDAAFSDLTPPTGKDWLAYYRGRAER